jgi:hypothetical protein
MKITRRKFLKSGTSAAAIGVGAVLLPQLATGQRVPTGIRSLGQLGGVDAFNAIGNFNPADFEPHVGTEFNLLSETHGHRAVTLIEVRTQRAQKGNRSGSFSLIFEGRDWQDVDQDVYYVSHASLGDFYALMAPVRESETSARLCYEAVVNRLA